MNKTTKIIIAITLIVFSLVYKSPAQESSLIQYQTEVLTTGCLAEALIDDNYAFIRGQTGLNIFDLTDIENPTLVKIIPGVFPDYMKESNNWLYCVNDNIFQIVRITNPIENTYIEGELEVEFGGSRSIYDGVRDIDLFVNSSPYKNNYILVLNFYPPKLNLININDKSNPVIDTIFMLADNGAMDFIKFSSSGLVVLQVNNFITNYLIDYDELTLEETFSMELSTEIWPSTPYRIISDPENLYLNYIVGSTGFNIVFDVIDTIFEPDYFEIPTGQRFNMFQVNNLLYCGGRRYNNNSWSSAIDIFEFDGLGNVEFIQTETDKDAQHFTMNEENNILLSSLGIDNYLYADTGYFTTYSLNEPEYISEMGYYERNGELTAFDINSQFSYVVKSDSTLNILNILAPDVPFIESTFNTRGFPNDIDVENNRAYIANGVDGIQIVNVQDPQEPEELGYYQVPSLLNAKRVIVRDNLAYVASTTGLFVYDISTPSNIIEKGYYQISTIKNMFLEGDLLYLTGISEGIVVLNVSNPSLILVAATFSTPFAHSIYVRNNKAYLTCYGAGFYIYDISDLQNVSLLSYYSSNNNYMGLDVFGGYAYTSNSDNIEVFDIHNSANCSPIAEYNNKESNRYVDDLDIAFKSGYIYNLSDYSFSIYKFIPTNFNQPKLEISLQQNPAFSEYADIYITSDIPFGDNPELIEEEYNTQIELTEIENHIYKGEYVFSENGTYTFTVNAVSAFEIPVSYSKTYQVENFTGNNMNTIVYPDKMIRLSSPEDSKFNKCVLLTEYTKVDSIALSTAKPVGKAYEFFPKTKLDKKFDISFYLSEKYENYNKNGLKVCKLTEDKPVPVISQYIPEQNTIYAQVDELAIYQLFYKNEWDNRYNYPKFGMKVFPNPSKGNLVIDLRLEKETLVSIDLFNQIGQKIATIDKGKRQAGQYFINWNENEFDLSNGVYYIILKTNNPEYNNLVNKIIFLK